MLEVVILVATSKADKIRRTSRKKNLFLFRHQRALNRRPASQLKLLMWSRQPGGHNQKIALRRTRALHTLRDGGDAGFDDLRVGERTDAGILGKGHLEIFVFSLAVILGGSQRGIGIVVAPDRLRNLHLLDRGVAAGRRRRPVVSRLEFSGCVEFGG